MQNKKMTIGQFAASAGVGVETVRFYQRKGLLAVPAQQNGIRRYDDEDVRHLTFIRRAQQAGFTLSEISELLTLDASQHHQRAQQLASQRIAELDIKIAEMQQARDRLKRLSCECRQAGEKQPCAILAAFDV